MAITSLRGLLTLASALGASLLLALGQEAGTPVGERSGVSPAWTVNEADETDESPKEKQSSADPPRMTLPRKDVKPFQYVEAKVPYYPPGGKGGKPITQMQLPVDPEESRKHF